MRLLLLLTLLAACDPLADGGLSVDPKIDEVFPAAWARAGGTRVTVLGHHFAADVKVTIWGQEVNDLVRESDGRLTFTTPRAQQLECAVQVTNPGGDTAQWPCSTYFGELSFTEDPPLLSPDIVENDGPYDFILGDVDGDGLDDVAAYDAHLMAALCSDGFGTVTWRADGGIVGREPDEQPLLLADVDGDDHADLITTLGVRRGGPGCRISTDLARFSIPLAGDERLAVGHFAGPGQPELLVASQPDPDSLVTLRRYRYTGGALGAVEETRYGKVFTPTPPLAVADFDDDGFDDLALVQIETDTTGQHQVLRLARGPLLEAALSTSELLLPYDGGSWVPAAGDFDADGLADVALIDLLGGMPALLVSGDGQGGLAAPQAKQRPCPFASADELVVGRSFPPRGERAWSLGVIGVHCNDGTLHLTTDDGGLGEPLVYPDLGRHLALGYLDDDDQPDLAYTSADGPRARFGNGLAFLPARAVTLPWQDALPWLPLPPDARPVTGSFGQERSIAASNGNVVALFSDGAGPELFRPDAVQALSLPGQAMGLFACDVDGDGVDELVSRTLAQNGHEDIDVIRTDDEVPLAELHVPAAADANVSILGARHGAILAGHFAGDGRCQIIDLDFFYDGTNVRQGTPRMVRVLGPESAEITPLAFTYDIELASEHFEAADYDGDGLTDLARTGDTDRATLYHNVGGLELRKVLLAPDMPGRIAALRPVRLADGTTEVWMLLVTDHATLLRRRLDGNALASGAGLGAAVETSSLELELEIGDFDLDGRPDAAIIDVHGNQLAILASQGTGDLFPAGTFRGGPGFSFGSHVAVDYDGDGASDFIGGSGSTPGRLLFWSNASR